MKQSKIIEAYKASEKLTECPISERDQWNLYKIRKILRSHYEFQKEREDAVREKYAEFTSPEGTITGEKAKEFLADINAIGNLDVELEEFDIPTITIAQGVTCKIMEPLEDFIEFMPPEE